MASWLQGVRVVLVLRSPSEALCLGSDQLAAALSSELAFVDAPRRWTFFWRWSSECGRALRRAGAVVLVSARVPRPLRRCLVALSPPFNARRLPLWLREMEYVELGVAAEESPWQVLNGMSHPNPYGLARAAFSTGRVAHDCRARIAFDLVTESAGSLRDLLRQRSTATRFDVVFLADADVLPDVIDVHGVAAYVAARGGATEHALRVAVVP